MEIDKNHNTPLTYNQWIKYKNTLELSNYNESYPQYLAGWYNEQSVKETDKKISLRDDYIQLLKDLSFLLGKNKSELFLSEIDFKKDEDLVYAIPFFVRKLKEIAKVLSYKREVVKNAKQKYSFIGSKLGVENLLYEYILKGFTKDENYISQIPISLLSMQLPALSSVKGNFFVELEELHDDQVYHDSDPSIDIQDYVDIYSIQNNIPFENLSEDELLGLISSRYMSRIAETPLSKLFNNYLSEIPSLSTVTLFNEKTNSIYNQIAANEKYLGENIYGLTAIRLNEIEDNADYLLTLNITQGNNWFYWPSGDKISDTSINNVFNPIYLNDSNFVNSGATGGDDYTNSDLFFSDKTGLIEGAWLQGPRVENSKGELNVIIEAEDDKEFIFPYVGFNITTKGTRWGGFSLNDSSEEIFKKLTTQQQDTLLKEYYSRTLPNSASIPIYINDTSLIYSGAYPSLFSKEADMITKRKKTSLENMIYNSDITDYVPSEEAYLYKFLKTDIPISIGSNEIVWPIERMNPESVPITVLNDTCLPINLNKINVPYAMRGAVAGLTPDTADIIYKLNTRNDDATEAAWLGSASIQRLTTDSNIPVYNTNSLYCASYTDGAIQGGLHTRINPKEKVSFIWMGEDAYADDVVFYRAHAADCPYLKKAPHNYYENQDYQNTNPLEDLQAWKKCRCKSVNYSPIGHAGQTPNEYNRMCDFLFADPQGVGENFAFNSWLDTRGFNALNSPQFSFYQLDGVEGDNVVGWGSGKWVTSAKTRMVLKKGRRYTYFRTSLRSDVLESLSNGINYPYLIISHTYKELNGITNPGANDFVILLDTSFSQKTSFETMRKIVDKMMANLLSIPSSTQISIIGFNENALSLNYLTSNISELRVFLNGLGPTPKPKDIYGSLVVADYILNTSINTEIGFTNTNNELTELCSSLDLKLASISSNTVIKNTPKSTNIKNIIILSDGYENINKGKAVPYAKTLQNRGINLYSLDIGPNSSFLDTMENLTTNENYFNVQRFLKETDYNEIGFANSFSSRFSTDLAITPTWYKMVKAVDGTWIATTTPTDMILNPGDYISYIHRDKSYYVDENGAFYTPSISFALNVDLYGWDYTTNTFKNTLTQTFQGAKPFWGKVYNDIEANYDQHFDKQVMLFGGQVRFIDDYLPIHQPELSNMFLNNGDFVRYYRRGFEKLNWIQNLNFNVYLSSYEWKKLNFYTNVSNLADLFRTGNPIDLISYASNEPSDIILEGYSNFINSKYNYYARNPFIYTEDLYLNSRCYTSFAIVNTGLVLEALEPYANLTNITYPTIANISFPSLAKSEKQLGKYMLPENLGVSYWRGRGYYIDIDLENLSTYDKLSAEKLFLDTNKYSSRNRGLTKKDQRSPVIISNIDSRWMFKAYQFSDSSGMITDILNNQKFTPYQSKFEITKKNDLGISRITDDFDFWNIPPLIGNWDSPEQYPLTFRKELTIASYEARKNLLLTDIGDLTEWKTDIYGNNYGLYKHKEAPSNSIVKQQIANVEFPESRF